VTHNSKRKDYQIVVTRRHILEVQPLNNRDSLGQQRQVGLRFRRVKFLDRQVVDPDQLHTRVGQQLGGIRGEVGEVFVESWIGHPTVAAVTRAKEDALRALPVMFVQLGRIDHRRIGRAIDDTRRPYEPLQGNLVHGRAALDEMQGGIDVRPGMRPQGVARQGQPVALGVVQHEVKFDGRVSGIDRRSLRIDGSRDVEPGCHRSDCRRADERNQECR